jgi:methanogenic corrinoid protein MtbC1
MPGVNDVPTFLLRGAPPEIVETFTHFAFHPDDSDAVALVDQLLGDGLGAESLMLDLLAPAARLMGEMWSSDEASFLDVTLGLSRIQQLMRQLRLPAAGLAPEQGSALLMPVPGEQHVLGLRMVEEMLLRDGWRVRLAQASDEMLAGQLAAVEAYDFVGFSLSGERLLPALRSAIREVRAQSRNRDVRIMVGGVAFSGHDRITPPLDADAVVGDAHEAVSQARRWHALAGVN